jgi:DNA-binding NtrC family response regulator
MTQPRPNRSGELPTAKRSNRPPPPDDPSAKAPSTFTLVVLEGPDAGASFSVDAQSPTRVLVGQSPLCNLVLKDTEVSRRHLSIRATPTALELMDLGSTNGTTVNGVSIKEALLHGGETVRVGSTILSVSRGEPEFAALTRASAFGRLLGESRAMRKIYPVLERLASTEGPILIEGEAGTGKELCAEELHAKSSRRDRPFLTLETASLDASEMASRLFGDDGLVEQAKGGTIVIDDASDLPLGVQTRLVPLVAARSSEAPRFVFTTCRDLDRAAGDGHFADALLAQLANAHVTLPPLRDRDVDVRLLATSFWVALAPPGGTGLPADFLPRFEHYPWPGNVRELASAVEARLRLGELATWKFEQSVRAEGDFIGAVVGQGLPFAQAKQVIMTEFERRYVEELVTQHGGSIQRAAAASGLAQRYFQLIRARYRGGKP